MTRLFIFALLGMVLTLLLGMIGDFLLPKDGALSWSEYWHMDSTQLLGALAAGLLFAAWVKQRRSYKSPLTSEQP